MLPRFPGLNGVHATGAYRCRHAPVVPPCPGQAPVALAGSVSSWPAQTVSAVLRTAQVASATKIANQITMPITLARATVPWPITSVVTLTTW
jgi:hypothetical protein